MIKKILLLLVAAIAVLLLYATTRPDSFSMQRELLVKAPPEKVYPLITDFGAAGWRLWSPWEKIDTDMKRTQSGAATGQGAVYAWEGNDKVGAGRMEITDAQAPTAVTIKLDFLKPFEAHNVAKFTLVPQGDGTRVTWAMSGPSSYLVKVMHIFFDMDAMVGKDFEAGLQGIKAQAEK